ncbi:MAG: Na+/H+ antiporter NhaC family protein [Flavobacteriaceae bacterium]|nr:Na+/H+ antiporter NhaC family protein [Flavobacteriaceae bacterium]
MNQFIYLLPFGVFIAVFLGSGLLLNDFYAVPAPVAALCGVVSAFLMPKFNFKQKISFFLKGCGDKNILTMCLIFLLAGAFAVVSKSVGSVDAIVSFGVQYLSPKYIPVGVFLIASFLAISAGTSVGTIVALSPIVFGLAESLGISYSLVGAALLCGAMFGDNLSFISDTTIASTQTMHCKMKDKFRANVKIALPASFISVLIFIYLGSEIPVHSLEIPPMKEVSFWLILPYLLVILLAGFGVNVFLVLLLGILFSGMIGIVQGSLSGLAFTQKIYEGFAGMNDIFLLALFTGGLAGMVENMGGIRYLLSKAKTFVKGKRSAYFSMGFLVALADIAVANNTIAIVLTGKVARKISQENDLNPRLSASVLDVFSCIAQGLIPYGAQMLILIELSGNKADYFTMLGHMWYLYFLLVFSVVFILLPKNKNIE